MKGLYGFSFDPLRRRMAAAGESQVPGFNAIIVSVDRANRKCDLWRQNSPYVMKGVRYATGLRNPPEYIKERGLVYVRYPSGSRMGIPEIEGPARAVPTVSAGSTQFPVLPIGPDGVLEGLQVVQMSAPGQGVAVTTGRAQFGGVEKIADVVKFGESLNAKVSGAFPGVMSIGQGATVGGTYVYVPLTGPPSAGTYRYDMIEVNSSLVINLVPGAAGPDPAAPAATSGSIPLAYILRRPGVSTILNEDITLVTSAITGVYIMLVSSERNPIPYADGAIVLYTDVNPTNLYCDVKDFNGIPTPNVAIEASITNANTGTGSLGAVGVTKMTSITDANGRAVFQYFRRNPNDDVIEKSPVIRFRTVASDNETTLWLDLRGSTNQSL